jgi:hypothetical protein
LISAEHRQILSLSWSDVAIPSSEVSSSAYVNVSLDISLPEGSAFSSWSVTVQTQLNSKTPIGVWDAVVSIPLSVGAGEDGELFFPSGYGETYYDPRGSTGGSVAGLYPSGKAVEAGHQLGHSTLYQLDSP